jgi:hypothetical protein
LIYFVHQFKPTFREAALLDDPEMLAAVTRINRQIHQLAPVLNTPSVQDGVTVTTGTSPSSPSGATAAEIAWMLKRHGGKAYLFAVNMRNRPTRGSFVLRESSAGIGSPFSASVLEETRSIPVANFEWSDDFKPYEVHLYELRLAR